MPLGMLYCAHRNKEAAKGENVFETVEGNLININIGWIRVRASLSKRDQESISRKDTILYDL